LIEFFYDRRVYMPHPNDNLDAAAIETDALFTLALSTNDTDAAWDAIAELHRRGTSDVYLRARQLCLSSLAHERRVGADILGQLGSPLPTYHEESVQELLAMLATEQMPEVLESIGIALGHRADLRAIVPLLQYQYHSDPAVRYGVVFGLLGHDTPEAIAALIALSADPEPHIRDWSTFGLAVQIDTDTPAIREALAARLNDTDPDTCGEAMVGLARRKDSRVLQPLLEALRSGDVGSLPLEAAAALHDPQLFSTLVQVREQWHGEQTWEYSLLEEAITACKPADH
jgi:HEAT repeat protein